MKLEKLVMCWPIYFDVTYDINHWMHDQKGQVDKAKAILQWSALYSALSKEIPVHILMCQENMPDLVFTANAGFIFDNFAILSRFSTKERQPEEDVFRNYFKNSDLDIFQPVSKYEGEGDHLLDHLGRHWMGSGFRTDASAAAEIDKILNTSINVLELVDERWYHLDTCFCPLSNGEIMWYPDAFSESSQHLIRQSFTNSIEVSLDDALLFSCNCICVNNSLFMPKSTTMLIERLKDLKYNVNEFDLSEFLKAGGAAKCLVLNYEDSNNSVI